MVRVYSPETTIILPRTTALTCYALVQEAIDAARAEIERLAAQNLPFPTFLKSVLDKLIAAHETLGLALAPSISGAESTKKADAELDNAWSGLYEFLSGWTRLDPTICPDWDGVQVLMALLFANGREFLQLNYKSEWAESERRLQSVRRAPYIDHIKNLGLLRVLEGIEAKHLNYGIALGITKQPEASDSPAIRESLRGARSALRVYIARAMAWADPDDEAATALSQTLLIPIQTWEAPTPSTSNASKTQGDMPREPDGDGEVDGQNEDKGGADLDDPGEP